MTELESIAMNAPETGHNIAQNYAEYFTIDPSVAVAGVDEEVDALQKLMDELYTTLLTLKDSNSDIFKSRLETFEEKGRQLEELFQQIDIVYDGVNTISSNLQQLETAATAIDSQIDSNPLKKMFGFFKGRNERPVDNVVIPPIFKTEELLSNNKQR